MTLYPTHDRRDSDRLLLIARLMVLTFIVALLAILWFATGITGVAVEPLSVPEPGFP